MEHIITFAQLQWPGKWDTLIGLGQPQSIPVDGEWSPYHNSGLREENFKVTNALSNQIFFLPFLTNVLTLIIKHSINLLIQTFKENSKERLNHRKHRPYHETMPEMIYLLACISVVLSCLFKEDSRSWDQFPNSPCNLAWPCK